MYDAAFVRILQRFSYLLRNRQRLFERYLPLRNALRQRRTFHKFHHQRALFDAVDSCDVRMIQRGQYLGLPLKTSQPLRILLYGLGQSFDCNFALELRILRPIHLAHSSGADKSDDLVWSQASSGRKRHSIGSERFYLTHPGFRSR
jgi:hypothetical protein